MPWKKVCPMDEKVKFISYALEGSLSMSSLCETFGISRKTGYKWINRYELYGVDGLKNLSKAPRKVHNKVSLTSEELILQVRSDYPVWGAPKIHAYLTQRSAKSLPSIATIGRILKSNGLTSSRHKKILKRPSKELTYPTHPNHVWTADFKGDFKTKCNTRCYPLTICDSHSRFLIDCTALKNTSYERTKVEFEKVFKKYGLPKIIKTDNGVPFSSKGGLSRMAVWWIELDILHELTDPGRPQQNGRHERFHRTLNEECIKGRSFSFARQQKEFNKFKDSYNNFRPHGGLDFKTPGSIYEKSTRQYSDKIQSYDYSYLQKTIKVNERGNFYFKSKRHFISHALNGKYIAVNQVGNELWDIEFRGHKIGQFDEKWGKIR